MRDHDSGKYLTALRLIELLIPLHPNTRITPNQAGNLTVLTPDGKVYEGFIDFSGAGSVEKLRDD